MCCNLKPHFNSGIHDEAVKRRINIPEYRVGYAACVYSVKTGLASVREVLKVGI